MSSRSGLPTGKKHVLVIRKPAAEHCFEVEGPHFEFDKSFVRPEGFEPLRKANQALEDDAPRRRALIFGHTDTVGTEEYNKGLSERRARAVLAILRHDAALWEKLYNDESWGLKSVQIMLNAVLGPGSGIDLPIDEDGKDGPQTKGAVKAFQARTDHPHLDQDGIAGPLTRHELFLIYFQQVAPQAVDDSRLHDFGGERCMGCSEFNPFSEEGRDEASRRVCVMVFDKSIEPNDLPCKIGDVGPCRANLLAPGETPVDGADDPHMAHFKCKVFRRLSLKCEGDEPHDDGSLAGWLAPIFVVPKPGEIIFDPTAATLDLFIANVKGTTIVDEVYLLESTDGAYSQRRSRKGAQPFDATVLFVRFTDVQGGKSYSLSRVVEDHKLPFFKDVPIERVNDFGPKTPAPDPAPAVVPTPAIVVPKPGGKDPAFDFHPDDDGSRKGP